MPTLKSRRTGEDLRNHPAVQPQEQAPKYWSRLPPHRKELARAYLRGLVQGNQAILKDDGLANVALEGLWNVMHFDADE